MSLYQLIYCSKRVISAEDDSGVTVDVEQLLIQARRNNELVDVSGLLYFGSEYYLQCLEGSPSAVNSVYNKIISDSRHSDIVLIDYRQIAKRAYSNWDMAYVKESSMTESLIKLYAGGSKFNPLDMSVESVMQLMQTFKSCLTVVDA
ncbi:BLUF domain-containing protein [Zhongshania arctica]|uniref:BLUF domain-containing protein n=1 Tax=Zhongshania arctica TaxID=3238302 RepID=A0ABV3TUK7_9GAMM|tara:strand:+ start:13864 stop:14304 length:441 start_codon:yes stop_codon:yes gene_type:complete